MPDDDLDRALAELRSHQARLDQAQRDLEQRVVVGRSKDRLVTVHAKGLGGVTRVEIDREAFDEHDEESLGEAVLEALTDAMTASGALFEEAFGELVALPELDGPAGRVGADALPAAAVPPAPAPLGAAGEPHALAALPSPGAAAALPDEEAGSATDAAAASWAAAGAGAGGRSPHARGRRGPVADR